MAVPTIIPWSSGKRAGRRLATNLAVRLPQRRQLQALPAGIPVPGIARSIQVKFASTRHEWEQAFKLVADNYYAKGFDVGGFDYRFTSYHALPGTVVLVAKEDERVVATLSLVPDNKLLGLPLESLYRQEISELRRQGRRLFEGSCLAARDLSTREFFEVFLTLMHLSWQQQITAGADTNVIAVNPRHSGIYTRLLAYTPLGPRRAYDKVQGAPAEAFYLDPVLMQARAPAMHQRFFGAPLPAGCLIAPRLPVALMRHFARHSSQTDPRTVEQLLWLQEPEGRPALSGHG